MLNEMLLLNSEIDTFKFLITSGTIGTGKSWKRRERKTKSNNNQIESKRRKETHQSLLATYYQKVNTGKFIEEELNNFF